MNSQLSKPVLNLCENGYLRDGAPCFNRTFHKAMSFHLPEGFAAVNDDTGAYHIDMDGVPLYPERYEETFGYYDGVATVRDQSGYLHINGNGKAMYGKRYRWSGNFQENRCVVQDENGFFHIDSSFTPLYEERFNYAGDFRYGIAVVRKGRTAFHIKDNGQPLHGNRFENTDVFHKGFAVAWDNHGAFHVDKEGTPIHNHRFKSAEPFYNGFALCKTHEDNWVRLMGNGHFTHLPVTSPAIDINEILDRIRQGEKAALILRHSERDHIPPGEWGQEAKLNSNGERMAGSFGRLFGKGIHPWTFVSSNVQRCIDTCYFISKGMGNPIKKADVKTTPTLGNPGPFMDTASDQSHFTPENFMDAAVRYLHSGQGSGFRPLVDGCRDMTDFAVQSIQKKPAILITHDFFIAGLFDYLGLHHPTPDDWVDYLDGVCLFSDGATVTEWRRFQGLKENGIC